MSLKNMHQCLKNIRRVSWHMLWCDIDCTCRSNKQITEIVIVYDRLSTCINLTQCVDTTWYHHSYIMGMFIWICSGLNAVCGGVIFIRYFPPYNCSSTLHSRLSPESMSTGRAARKTIMKPSYSRSVTTGPQRPISQQMGGRLTTSRKGCTS